MTKWTELTRWLSKHPTFNWSQMNRAFGHKPSDLNSYTTYLNTIKNAGFVVSTGRGEYRVMEPKYLARASRRELCQTILLDQAYDQIKSKEGRIDLLEKAITKLCEEQAQLKYRNEELERGGIQLRSRILFLEGRTQTDQALIVNQLERLNAYNEKVKYLEAGYLARFMNWLTRE